MARSRLSGRLLPLLLGAALPGLAQGVLGVGDPAAILRPGSWSVTASAYAFSDPVPLHGFFNRWQGGFTPRASPVALGAWGVRSEAAMGPFKVSVWDRTSFLGRMSADAARLLWMTKQKQSMVPGESFEIRLDLDALHRTGISMGGAWQNGALSLGADLAFWTATGAQFGQAQGRGMATGPKAYTFDVTVDYAYNQNRLYTLAVPSERGWGCGLDLGAAWAGDAWEGRVSVRDLGNRTRWARLPRTTASARSGRSHTDAGGYLVFDPTIEGWEGVRSLTWREPVAWTASLARNFRGVLGRVRLERIGPVTLRSLEAERVLAPGLLGSLGYESRNRVWTAGAAWRGFWLRAGMSSLTTQRTRGVSIETGLRGRW